ncbi:RagB/SusD family nutrient uptake outer membrane protein [Sphingobacterium bovistauri]|uniref:RagB/SusD family nutrient uptake outer membrane protein n=1 Tax=Sphingobacterium bovistauri TaxID=2781959 RepID=A0ABS7ZCL7_9SPHI|nr:RagB/SusD family nutrient uptake outer membrane protein [Sphingobacterium bovistauri]MCA5006684.1 RagB/SusD family nutrient uptake outer membrane protein [Sphingobacterium bovistauri]
MNIELKKYLKCCFIMLSLGFYSCDSYLDVKPEDKFLSEGVFNDKYNINKAINGVYVSLAKPNLYGRSLTMSTVDMLAQYYNFYHSSVMSQWSEIAMYQYSEKKAQTEFELIWSNAYLTILNINSFIEQLEASNDILSEDHKNILLGEAYGLRAFVHFDLLRLYGPIYSVNPGKPCIPYLDKVTQVSQPLLGGNAVVEKVLEDLNKAEKLLEKDPIRREGVQPLSGLGVENDFYRLRNRRFNYYAVLGTKARVLLYKGNKPEALHMCEKIIDEASGYFPWTAEGETQPLLPNPNRIFYSEVIFGLDNYTMYDAHRELFSASLEQSQILVPTRSKLQGIYENNEDDYRYRVNWADGIAAGKDYKTLIKYQDLPSTTVAWRNFQPLLRISEIYYIAAECSSNDMNRALSFLDEVRRNRGLINLASNVDLSKEIEKEYKKEFVGEGQLFYYYKRINKGKVPYPIDGYGDISMTESEYVVPLPLKELEYRVKK